MWTFDKIRRIFYKKQEKGGYIFTRIFGVVVQKKRDSSIIVLPRPEQARSVGKWTYCAPGLRIGNSKTYIGSFCSIGNDVVIGHGEHPQSFLSSSPYLYLDYLRWKSEDTPVHNEYLIPDPIVIGNDVWIGDGAFIKNGVRIGDGAIIGAHSFVTKDIPPYAVAVGAPAHILRYRFSESIIERLLATRWWELDDDLIRRIPYDDIENALSFLERHGQ